MRRLFLVGEWVRKKKIVFITPGVETGGAEKQLALLAKGLSQNGFLPLIISLAF